MTTLAWIGLSFAVGLAIGYLFAVKRYKARVIAKLAEMNTVIDECRK